MAITPLATATFRQFRSFAPAANQARHAFSTSTATPLVTQPKSSSIVTDDQRRSLSGMTVPPDMASLAGAPATVGMPLEYVQPPSSTPPSELDFDNARLAFANKTNEEILRAFLVFHVSAVPLFVQNSRLLLTLSERLFGQSLTHYALRKTFFGHFCAGIDAQDIVPTVDGLRRSGIGAILDYAAEADVQSNTNTSSTRAATDAHMQTFLMCINTASTQPRGVAAMKLTGLAAPELLETLSMRLLHAHERRNQSETALTELSASEKDQFFQVESALNQVAESARNKSVRLLVDAEQTYFQPAIDFFVRRLQRQYNRGFPTIFNTYQCYLRDSAARVNEDLSDAKDNGYMFAAKLVRGAYMFQEAKLAAAQNRPNPIFPTIEATHNNYNQVMETLIRAPNREVMVASHNEQSVRRAVTLMKELDLSPNRSGVLFGQLLGMCDHVSYTLGRYGYSVYKYVPYGPVGEVIPYLIRRAEENSAVMVGATKERKLVREELLRRISMST